MKNSWFFALISVAFSGTLALAQDTFGTEKVGLLTIDEVLLRPTYVSRENKGGEFNFSDSSFRVRWQKDKNLSGVLAAGSLRQRNIPAYYLSTQVDDTLGFYEAYADYQGVYGRVRAGLQPLNFGFYGTQSGRERIFHRPLLYSERFVGLRDFGVSLYTAHNGYFTELIAHNGEVDRPQDGNVWVTARWGWTNDRHLRIQASAQTGRTKPSSTAASGDTTMGFDPTLSALWRFGSFSIFWYPKRWEVTAQVTAGEREQGSGSSTVSAGMLNTQLEAVHYLGSTWGWGFRHDQLEPNDKVKDDGKTQVSGLLFVRSEDSTSLLSLVLSKNFEEKNEISNDQVLVSWRLTPYIGR